MLSQDLFVNTRRHRYHNPIYKHEIVPDVCPPGPSRSTGPPFRIAAVYTSQQESVFAGNDQAA